MLPWSSEALRGWNIVGMNHYHLKGERHLFVAMVQGDRCIKAEGVDEGAVFAALEAQAGPSEMSPGAIAVAQMQEIVDNVRAAHGEACVCLLCDAVKRAARAGRAAGNVSSCASCGHVIVWKGEYWKHVDATYRHPARPVEKPAGAR